ncbi:MAG: tRNA adenosine(34) deaminase TadA [Halieaceae bacterium]|jgi:tRNA(adenine34) deaminase|nr:tRNA adenosine(34) deaminase TadA [Halieaceae bacterium]
MLAGSWNGGAVISKAEDEAFLARALKLAAQAAAAGEVPVGAVLVRDGALIGEAGNAQISQRDPSAHAEILALRDAAKRCDNYRLPGGVLYVTLEPCTMCCGALIHARIEELVFAAREPRAGAVVSTRSLLDEAGFNHRVRWREYSDLASASGDLLREFFRQRR